MNQDDTPARLKAWREAYGKTQTQIAADLSVTKAAVSSWELGKSKPSLDHLSAFVALFGISLAQFWGPFPRG